LLPSFNDAGYLPSGIHLCEIDELVERFGSGSPEREVATEELLDFLNWARSAGISRVIVNGSYVTAKQAPNDIDVVVLPGEEYPRNEARLYDQETHWPFLQVFVAIDRVDLEDWALNDFGTDRQLREKGVVEVKL